MKAEPKHVKRESILLFSVVTIGVSSAIFQLLALREFLNVFYGNELIFGIILSNWLLLTGIGSYLGRFLEKTKNKIYLFVILQTIIAIIPMVTIFAVRLMKTYAIMPGEITSTANIIFLSFFLLAPYCLLSGFLLILACSLLSLKRDSRQIGKIYISDSVGSIAGGMIFSLLLVFFFTPFQNTAFLLIIVLLSGIFIIASNKKLKYVILLSSFLLASLIISLSFNADLETTRGMYPGQEIIFHGSSPYGNIVITEMENQINFYENGIFLFSTNDTISAEQKVHYAMVQHKNPKSILLISGGVSGTINEILKYRPNKIDYVELDPLLIDAGKKYANLSESKIVRLIISDGRVFVKTTDSKYDVVIIDLPDPSNAQINRFYTIEFFRELKNILNEGGIVSLSISSSENYMSIETSILNSVIYNTLKSVFNNVIIIPSGDENFFIASEYNLSTQISSLIENKGIKTKFVNRDYLKASLSEERLIYAEKLIKNQNTTINLDFNPIAYYYYIIFWAFCCLK
jgi:spermidine synthase